MNKIDKARILIVEDHAFVAEALQKLVDSQADLACCGNVKRLGDVIPATETQRPGLIILDLLLGNEDATPLISDLLAKFEGLKILVFSQVEEFGHIQKTIRLGASGYITKEASSAEILEAVRGVLAGGTFLGHKLAMSLFKKMSSKNRASADATAQEGSLPPLTPRESEVYKMIGLGKKSSVIAGELGLSMKTVQVHRENIKKKLGYNTANELVHKATLWYSSNPEQSHAAQE